MSLGEDRIIMSKKDLKTDRYQASDRIEEYNITPNLNQSIVIIISAFVLAACLVILCKFM